jgi:diguanylate cyclase (GGDEF)-like protein
VSERPASPSSHEEASFDDPVNPDWIRSEVEGHYYVNRFKLRFGGGLEQRYRRYRGLRDRRYVRQMVNMLLVLYAVYGVLDWMILGAAVEPVLQLRYAMGMPGLTAVWFLVHAKKLEAYLDKLVMVGLFWLSLTTLSMARVVPMPEQGLYLISELGILMAGLTIGRMRFWTSLISALLFMLSYVLVLNPFYAEGSYLLYVLFLTSCAVALCLLAQYSIDRTNRREFLQRVLIHRKNHQLERLNSRLRDLAEVDSLTGIANRRTFDQVLDEEWRRARRRGYSLAILMCDIDYFKAYNDTFGHQQGYICIQQVAKTMKQMVHRPGDLVARYGGEEFAVVLPALDAEEAANVARHICEGVRSLQLSHPLSQNNDYVTISVGVAAIVPSRHNRANDLVGWADEALYKAKKSGRNQVRTYRNGNARVTDQDTLLRQD